MHPCRIVYARVVLEVGAPMHLGIQNSAGLCDRPGSNTVATVRGVTRTTYVVAVDLFGRGR